MGPRRQRYRPYYWGPHCIVYTRLRRLSFGVVVKTFYVPREKTNTKHIKNWQSSPNQTNKRRYKYVCKKRLNNVLFRSGRGMEYSQHIVNSTRPFGARAAFAARYACSGRKNRNIIMWSGQMSMIDCRCKLATWKCQEPRRHAPGKQPGLNMNIIDYTAYVPDIL